MSGDPLQCGLAVVAVRANLCTLVQLCGVAVGDTTLRTPLELCTVALRLWQREPSFAHLVALRRGSGDLYFVHLWSSAP